MSDDSISLLDHINSRFDAQEKAVAAALAAQQAALEAALTAVKDAMAIKDVADRDALQLARSTQSYKDEKANELRAQLGKEREDYATKTDLHSMIDKVESLQKFLWMGLGAMLAVQLFIGIVFAMIKRGTS